MSIALHAGSPRAAIASSLTRLGRVTLAVLAFALAVAGVTFMRTFVFEYFHGDPAALHGLVQVLLGN